jgi:hypothetical protein
MTQAMVADTVESKQLPWPRFRLSGLLRLVLAAGLWLGVVARARPVGVATWFGESLLGRWVSLAISAVAVIMVLSLAAEIHDWARGGAGRRRVWPLFWRLAAVALLLAFLAEQSWLLRIDPSTDLGLGPGGEVMNLRSYYARLRLMPVAGGLLLAGVVLGMRSRRSRHPAERSTVSTWCSAILIGLAGVVIVATLMIIPYLVLIAIEAVENAKMRPGEGSLLINPPRPPMPRGMAERLDAALPAAGLALLACLVTAGWLSSSLRRSAAGEANRPSGRELSLGLLLAAALPIAGFGLIFRTLPSVQPLALEGLGLTIGWREFVVVALGFGFFAAGLVARVVVPAVEGSQGMEAPMSPAGRSPLVRLLRAVAALVLGVVILSSVAEIQARYPPSGLVLPRWLVHAVFEPLQSRGAEIWSLFQWNGLAATIAFDPDVWFPAVAIPWLLWRSSGLLVSARRDVPASLDQVFDSPRVACRFAGYSLAFWALLLAALPTLALAGLIVLHHALAAIQG